MSARLVRSRSRDFIVQQLQGVFQILPTRAQEANLMTLRKMVPNSLTVMAVVVGLTVVPLALRGDYQLAVLCVFFAGLLDGLDGPAARALNSTSRFGAELDSLCDLVNFGVSPCLLVYLWHLNTLGWHGWLIAVLWCVCMASRLARFNAGVDFNQEKWSRNFFMGIPAPAGAFLLCAPLAASFRFGAQIVADDRIIIPYFAFVSFMLISEVPTFSSKMIDKSTFAATSSKLIAVVLAAAFVFAVATDLWGTYLLMAICYLLSFPISLWRFTSLAKKHAHEKDL